MSDMNVFPACLGWNNTERDAAQKRLYATDMGNNPRWDKLHPGGRVAEYAAEERGAHEGDRYLVVRVGDRFVPDSEMDRVASAIRSILNDRSE